MSTQAHEQKHPWDDRDQVFDRWCKAQGMNEPHVLNSASFDGEYYGHHRVGALAVLGDGVPYVLVHGIHDEDMSDTFKGLGVSLRDIRKAASVVSVNSLEQARAVVRSLVVAFGEVVKQ